MHFIFIFETTQCTYPSYGGQGHFFGPSPALVHAVYVDHQGYAALAGSVSYEGQTKMRQSTVAHVGFPLCVSTTPVA